MGLFRTCKCGHIEEDHAMDALEGEQECMHEDEETGERCDCEQFDEVFEEGGRVS